MAQRRLKAALSDDLGEIVERSTWIRLAQNEVDSARLQSDKVPNYKKFVRDHILDAEDHAWVAPEDVEGHLRYKANIRRRDALLRERHDAEMKAWNELRLTEKGLKAAESDDIGQKVKRATLIRLIQEQIEPAQKRIDEAR